jgi:hypothetical protein
VVEAYDPTKDYSGAETNIIVYGYNLCDAFYKGEHNVQDINACVDKCVQCLDVVVKANPQHAITTTYAYENGFSASGTKTVCCANADCPLNKEAEVSAVLAIFEGFQYATRQENGTKYGMVLSYCVNTEALVAYETTMNTKVSYGVLAVAKANATDTILDASGESSVKNIISTEITGTPSVDLIIWGDNATWDAVIDGVAVKDMAFYIVGYYVENEAVSYFSGANSSSGLMALATTSYSEVKEK